MVEGTIDKMAAVLELENIVKVKIYINQFTGFEGIDLTERLGLLIWSGDKEMTPETATFETADERVKDAGYKDGRYFVRTNGIPAKNWGDTFWLRLYVDLGNGNYAYSKLTSYSPSRYLNNVITKHDNAYLIQLSKTMLNYGSAAQIYFNHNADKLINTTLPEAERTLNWDASILQDVKVFDESKAGEFVRDSSVFKNRNAVLALEGAVNIQFRFNIDQAAVDSAKDMGILYWSEATHDSSTVLTKENADMTGKLTWHEGAKRYVHEYPGVAAKNLDDTVYACAYVETEDGVYYSGVVAYSVEKYIANTIAAPDAEASVALKNAVKWLGNYGEDARIYFYEKGGTEE